MNSKKIRKALKHVSPEDAEQIGKIWGAPHKEEIWQRINEKTNFKEESFMQKDKAITQSKNRKWTGYLGLVASVALFCGIVGGGITFLKSRQNLLTAENAVQPSEYSPAEAVYSAEEETLQTEPETVPMFAMGLETVTETTTTVIETATPETSVTTVMETVLKTVRAETTAVPQTQAVIETIQETVPETAIAETNISAETLSEAEAVPDISETAEIIIDAPAEIPDAGITDETPEDVFAGTYSEQYAHRGVITVTNNGNNTYMVHIHWAGSALESAEWEFSGEFNGRQVLYYTDCVKTHVIYNEEGNRTEEIEYTNGTGHLQIAEEGTKTGLVWVDDMENAAEDAFFIKE